MKLSYALLMACLFVQCKFSCLLFIFLICLAFAELFNIPSEVYPGSPIPSVNKAWDTTKPVNNMNLATMVQTQATIWIPIMLFLITLAATCALCTLNQGRDRDSLLYAKFLSSVEKK